MSGKRSKLWKKIGIAIVCLCMLSYCVFHFASLFSEEIGTVVAGPTTEKTVEVLNGYIFRDSEYIISNYGGAVDYAVNDGEKVAAKDQLATVYSEGNSVSIRDTLAVLDERIELLRQSTEDKPSVSELTDLRKIASDAYSSLMKKMASGKVSAIGADQKKLLVALNSIAMLTQEDFTIEDTLGKLLDARKTLLAAGGESEEIAAAKSGYFYSGIDGYESSFSGEAAKELDAEGFIKLFEDPLPNESALSYVGKMSYDSTWYFASVMHVSKSETFEEGVKYDLEFSGGGYFDIPMTLYRMVLSEDGKQAVLVFSTNILPSDFGFERRQTAKIVTDSISGIYVPVSAIHRVNFERVVYTLSGSVVQMKYVDIIYEGPDYFIVRDGYGEDEEKVYLKSNDLLVISGSNLFDGRILD